MNSLNSNLAIEKSKNYQIYSYSGNNFFGNSSINRTYVRKIERYLSIEIYNKIMLEALDSKVKSSMLKFLALNKGKEFTISEIANCLKISKSRTSEILRELADREVLNYKYVGKSILFSLSLENKNAKNVLEFIEKSERLEEVLDEFLRYCKRELRGLISIVLFGSYARGIAKRHSDIDLLVVLEKLPEMWNERKKLFEKIKNEIHRKYEKNVEVTAITRAELSLNLEGMSSLFITFALGHRVLLDDGTFAEEFGNFSSKLAKREFVYYEGGNKWEVKKEVLKYLH